MPIFCKEQTQMIIKSKNKSVVNCIVLRSQLYRQIILKKQINFQSPPHLSRQNLYPPPPDSNHRRQVAPIQKIQIIFYP